MCAYTVLHVVVVDGLRQGGLLQDRLEKKYTLVTYPMFLILIQSALTFFQGWNQTLILTIPNHTDAYLYAIT